MYFHDLGYQNSGFGGPGQSRENQPAVPDGFARGYKLLNLQPCSFVAADSLICSVVALWLQLCYRLKLQPCSLVAAAL